MEKGEMYNSNEIDYCYHAANVEEEVRKLQEIILTLSERLLRVEAHVEKLWAALEFYKEE